jgi:hypothetical protein
MPQINDLPPEILGEVFGQVTAPEDISFPSKINFALPAPFFPNYRSPASPYSISHVSRRWRDIALNTAVLWSRLCVVQPQTEGIVRLLKEWLTRAGCFPLRLSLYEHSYQPSAAVAVLVFFLDSIHRCISFEMEVKTLVGRHPDYSRIGTREPTVLLQSLSIRMDEATAAHRPFIITRLLSSPNLRFVRWHNNQVLPLSVASHLWSELRELRLEIGIISVELGYALSYCKNLQRLAISRIHVSPRSLPPVTLPRLTHLSATFQATVFFDYLTVTSLTDLELFGGEWTWSSVLGMLRKSKVVLRVFKLRQVDSMIAHWPVEEQELLLVLAMSYFSALKALEVEHLLGPRTIRLLLSSHLPHLERLVLTVYPQIPSRLLSDLFQSRLGLPNRLDSNMNDYLEYAPDGIRLSLDIPSK